MLRQATDGAGFVCVMVDNESKPIDCSSAGAELLARGGLLKVEVGGRLATVSEVGTKRLRHLVSLASTGGGGGLIRVTNTADDTFCMIQVVPGGVSADNPFDPRYAGCALVFVRQPTVSRPVDVQYVRLALDCTRAEAEVGAALASGHSPVRISADRGVALTTIRTQIQSLLTLTGRTGLRNWSPLWLVSGRRADAALRCKGGNDEERFEEQFEEQFEEI